MLTPCQIECQWQTDLIRNCLYPLTRNTRQGQHKSLCWIIHGACKYAYNAPIAFKTRIPNMHCGVSYLICGRDSLKSIKGGGAKRKWIGGGQMGNKEHSWPLLAEAAFASWALIVLILKKHLQNCAVQTLSVADKPLIVLISQTLLHTACHPEMNIWNANKNTFEAFTQG